MENEILDKSKKKYIGTSKKNAHKINRYFKYLLQRCKMWS